MLYQIVIRQTTDHIFYLELDETSGIPLETQLQNKTNKELKDGFIKTKNIMSSVETIESISRMSEQELIHQLSKI